MTIRFLTGDCRELLKTLPDKSVHCVVTSPPYWGLRDYQVAPSVWGGMPDCEHEWGALHLDRSRRSPGTQNGSLTGDGRYQAQACRFEIRSNFCTLCGAWRGVFGLEPTYQLYVEHSVDNFREVRRVLRDDGTVWLNLGDSYATGAGKVGEHPGGGDRGERWRGRPALGSTSQFADRKIAALDGNLGVHTAEHSGKQAYRIEQMGPMSQPNRMPQPGLKPKDLCGIPWRVAFALQADGWWLIPAQAFGLKKYRCGTSPVSRISHANAGVPPAVTVALRGRDGGGTAELGGEQSNALRGSQGGGDKPYLLTSAVRRLTPRECERLQGFPDDYTLVRYRGKPAMDGPRYKALGNSMAVPVMRWILSRIERLS